MEFFFHERRVGWRLERVLGGISQKSKENRIHAAKGYRKYHFHEHSGEQSNSRKCSNSIFKILN